MFERCLLSFLPQLGRVGTQFRRKYKFTDFRKANEPVKCHFIFKYSLKKAQEKILNPPENGKQSTGDLHVTGLHEMNLCAKFSKFLFSSDQSS